MALPLRTGMTLSASLLQTPLVINNRLISPPWQRFLAAQQVQTNAVLEAVAALQEQMAVADTLALVKPLARGVLSGSLAVLYTSPTGQRTAFAAATFTNVTSAYVVLQVTVMQDPTHDGGAFRSVVTRQAIPPYTPYEAAPLLSQALAAGGQVQANGAGIEYILSGTQTAQ